MRRPLGFPTDTPFREPAILIFEPGAVATAPTSVVSLVLCWPVAYWIVYRRDETMPA